MVQKGRIMKKEFSRTDTGEAVLFRYNSLIRKLQWFLVVTLLCTQVYVRAVELWGMGANALPLLEYTVIQIERNATEIVCWNRSKTFYFKRFKTATRPPDFQTFLRSCMYIEPNFIARLPTHYILGKLHPAFNFLWYTYIKVS